MRFWIRVCFRIALGEGGKNSTFDNLGKLDNIFFRISTTFQRDATFRNIPEDRIE